MLKSFYNAKVLQTGCNRVAKCNPTRPNLTLTPTKRATHPNQKGNPPQPKGQPTPTKRTTHPNPPEGRELDYLFPVNPYRVNRTNVAYRTNACRLAKHIKLPPFGRVGVGCPFGWGGFPICRVLPCKKPCFSRQKAVFREAKHGLLHSLAQHAVPQAVTKRQRNGINSS